MKAGDTGLRLCTTCVPHFDFPFSTPPAAAETLTSYRQVRMFGRYVWLHVPGVSYINYTLHC
jgi:hypothetical protein